MKRFVTYLYEYKNGHRIKNTGHLRVDIRNQMVNMQVSIKHSELKNETGTFYVLVRDEEVYGIPLEDIPIKSGQYNGRITCMYHGIKDSSYSMQQAIGIGIRYESGCYMASSWKDEEDEVVAGGDFLVYGVKAEGPEESKMDFQLDSDEEFCIEEVVEGSTTETYSSSDEQMEAASISVPVSTSEERTLEKMEENNRCMISPVEMPVENEQENIYCKLNLNEIYALPSSHWHYSNNSFLIHGFWNYGYLVLKEKMEDNQKKYYLGVPGVFEQPERVMATYFGFPNFETIPSQMVEMEIGQKCRGGCEKNDQQSRTGTFGCWFTNL